MRHLAVATLVLVVGCGGGGGGEETPDAGPCDPTVSACTYEHDFGQRMIAAGEEQDGVCQSWTLNNETELWVNVVEMGNDGGYHHSNWFFVPDNNFELPDGAWDCSDSNFDELTAAILGGVLYAQSTQATSEVQAFAPGVAVKVPPHARIIANTHLLNVGETDLATNLRVRLETLPPDEVTVRLTPFRLTFYDLHIAPMATTIVGSTCDVKTEYEDTIGAPFDFKLHYVLPHYHALGSSFSVSISGGARDGEVIHEIGAFDAEAHGKTIDPAIDMSDATGFTFSCGFTNPRDTEVRWGIGDQEMCVMLGFAESDMAFDAAVETGVDMGTDENGNFLWGGSCGVVGFPFLQQ
jgi:hypothetical protein